MIAELNIEQYTNPKEEDIFGCFVTEIEEEGVVFAIVQGENGEETTASTENRNNFRTKPLFSENSIIKVEHFCMKQYFCGGKRYRSFVPNFRIWSK